MSFRACVVVILLAGAAVAARTQDRWDFPERSANLKVLPKDISGADLRRTMFSFTRGLGIRCSSCHKGEEHEPLSRYDFVSDERPNKEKAREMLRMVADIKGHLAKITPSGDRAVEVSCYTCHRGRPRPLSLHAELSETYRKAGADSSIALYRTLKAELYGRSAYDFTDFSLNGFGREVLEAGDLKGAAAIYALATEEFPSSGGAWNGRADAALRLGEAARAMEYYDKAVQLNPRNAGAKRILDSLKTVTK